MQENLLYYSAGLGLLAILTTGFAYHSLMAWGKPGSRTFGLLMLSMSIWAAFYLLEIVLPFLPAKIIAKKILFLGMTMSAPLWLGFALRYTGISTWWSKRGRIYLLAIPGAITFLLGATNESHTWIWQSLELAPANSLGPLITSFGPAFWICTLMAYFFIVAGIFIYAIAYIRSPKAAKKQIGIILAGAFITPIINAVLLSGVLPQNIDPTPLSFGLSAPLLAFGFFRFGLLNLSAIAASMVVNKTAHSNLPNASEKTKSTLRIIPKIMNSLDLFPISAKIQNNSLTIAGHDLNQLADEYGTPLYLYDKATMDASAIGYKKALASHYPPTATGRQAVSASVTYAGKAFLCTAIAQWTQTHGLYVDCTGEGEIAIALAGGVPREHILVHGVNKSVNDLIAAIQHAGTIVVDNLEELERMERLRSKVKSQTSLWVRFLPGKAVETHHAHTQTGQHDSKFGMTYTEILEAANFCRQHNLPLAGLHFHQGSNFRDANPLKAAIELGLEISKEIGFSKEWHFSPGGGWGVAYHEDELPQPDTNEYVRVIAENLIEGCKIGGLPLPHLHLEPGRSLAARAGVAIYRVGAIKKRGDKVWILTDGGMTDNPRHAMYGARYSCLPVSTISGERSEVVSIAGPYCESGDVVIEDLLMPKLKKGDLIAIPASGAYHLSMSSNYNGSRRPAVLWLEKGKNVRVIQRRETIENLLARDEMI